MKIIGYSKNVTKECVSGVVRVRSGRKVIKVHYDFVPRAGAGYMQWGADMIVLGLTQPLVERLCYMEDECHDR